MLNSISRLYKINTNDLRFNLGFESQERLKVFEKIDKHLSVLHYRNSQIRNAIMAGSEEFIAKRHSQYVTVLNSYVRLIIVELHEPITQALRVDGNASYVEARNKTFAGYEALLAANNLSSAEMLKQGSDFARKLFQMELQIKQYKKLEEDVVYPLYNEMHEKMQSGRLFTRRHN